MLCYYLHNCEVFTSSLGLATVITGEVPEKLSLRAVDKFKGAGRRNALCGLASDPCSSVSLFGRLIIGSGLGCSLNIGDVGVIVVIIIFVISRNSESFIA